MDGWLKNGHRQEIGQTDQWVDGWSSRETDKQLEGWITEWM